MSELCDDGRAERKVAMDHYPGMLKTRFSHWAPWDERNTLDEMDKPGLYVLAHFTRRPTGEARPLTARVIYIGESHDRALRVRLNEFGRTAFGRGASHTGGKAYRKVFGVRMKRHLYVARFVPAGLKSDLLPLFIRYTERRLILTYALMFSAKPKCNNE